MIICLTTLHSLRSLKLTSLAKFTTDKIIVFRLQKFEALLNCLLQINKDTKKVPFDIPPKSASADLELFLKDKRYLL